MFALLLVFVVVVALVVAMNLMNGPGFGPRRGRTIHIVERDAPRDVVVERQVPRERVVERVVERPTVVEREYDV